VHEARGQQWSHGDTAVVRGRRWIVLHEAQYVDCRTLRLTVRDHGRAPLAQTLLLPFDRPRRAGSPSSIAVVRPRSWIRSTSRTAIDALPFGGLNSAVSSGIDLLPYQLEPALAMLREGCARIMIADAVGLGKTIQAGLIVRQLSAEGEGFRALVVTPAGLRHQWAAELRQRFDVHAEVVTSPWLARTARALPPDIGPWHPPGTYICSFELIRRPEILRPLEDVRWDLLIVDEAHAATAASARRVAVHAIALRARRVLLLTATPHGGDDEEFRALCRIGLPDGRSDPITFFRRGRGDVGLPRRRRTTLLAVRPSHRETRAHRLLERYTSRVWQEAGVRRDAAARLAVTVLRKRALSSMASLALSCRRRLALLRAEQPVPQEEQLWLPLDEDDGLCEDAEPESILGAPGLADAARERRWLETIADAATAAATHESKIARLVRLLARIREPVIVFTEYRDTLARLHHALRGLRTGISMLHGAMTAAERSAEQHRFNESDSLLLATDAAAEGLNLHWRCRTVVHFELPWSPARLEQRTGRVDRLGQSRVVHEIMLVAADTAERLVLAPLVRRAARAASFGSGARLLNALSESRVAAAIMDHAPVEGPDVPFDGEIIDATTVVRTAASLEAERLSELRHWNRTSIVHATPLHIPATALRARQTRLPPGGFYVCSLNLASTSGLLVHSEVVVLHESCDVPFLRTAGEVRTFALRCRRRFDAAQTMLLSLFSDRIGQIAQSCQRAAEALADREQIVSSPSSSAARQLVQGGLFDRRAIRTNDEQRNREAADQEHAQHQLNALESYRHLMPSLEVRAILLVSGRSPS
jgi:superfamily II DNA or RNA helicase